MEVCGVGGIYGVELCGWGVIGYTLGGGGVWLGCGMWGEWDNPIHTFCNTMLLSSIVLLQDMLLHTVLIPAHHTANTQPILHPHAQASYTQLVTLPEPLVHSLPALGMYAPCCFPA